jgi:cyclase
MRILTKFDLRNGSVVKGIHFEGVEKIGDSIEVYTHICEHISNNITNRFEIILNDVTASLYDVNSGEGDIKDILTQSCSLPHIYSGGVNCGNVDSRLNMGADRIMLNTSLHNDTASVKNIINKYGAQLLIASIETRWVNNDYYVYKSYGKDDTGLNLLDWINVLYDNGIIEILIISIDKDGTLTGYDNKLLSHIDDNVSKYKHLSILYAGGIQHMHEIQEIETKYPFITGVCISSLFYKSIPKYLFFLSYIGGNRESVMKHFSFSRKCKIVDSISSIPFNGELCINGHFNTYQLLKLLKEKNDFVELKKRLNNKTLKYVGICSGLQILASEVKDEYSDDTEDGLNILEYTKTVKLETPQIGFIKGRFFCHSYIILDRYCNSIEQYKKENIVGYQFHPENSR